MSNPALVAALEAHADRGDRRSWIDVLRTLLQGRLLVDVTEAVRDPETGAPYSVSGGQTTDGDPVVFVYTDRAQVIAHTGVSQPDTAPIDAVGALQLAAAGAGHGLAIDPAGSCLVLGARELGSVLRGRRNRAVKEALTGLATTTDPSAARAAVLDVLRHPRTDDVLLQAVALLPGPGPEADGQPVGRLLTAPLPHGGTAALAFTSSLEVEAHSPGAAYTARPVHDVLAGAVESGCTAVLLDPAGPSLLLDDGELRAVLGR